MKCLLKTIQVSFHALSSVQFLIVPLSGIDGLFDSLISAIIKKKDIIDRENELKKRDSVFLSSVNTPLWASQDDEEDAPEKTRSSGGWGLGGWSCCGS